MKPRNVLIALVLLGVVALLNLPAPTAARVKSAAGEQVVPFQNVMWLLIRKSKDVAVFLADSRRAAEDRQRLVEEVAALRQRLWGLEALAQGRPVPV